MANHYFQFKQFTVYQEKCAMKVCTDACIFGAFIAKEIQQASLPVENILDIGTGTGLLSLMLAQKTNAVIDAVEIDSPAFQQAKNNFDASPWQERLHILEADINSFSSNKKYDYVIANPPFFETYLPSPDPQKNRARHGNSLTLQQLIEVIPQLLADKGSFATLLPFHRLEYFENLASFHHFHLAKKVIFRPAPSQPFFRGILVFSKTFQPLQSYSFMIKDEDGNYTSEFSDILKDYYLYL